MGSKEADHRQGDRPRCGGQRAHRPGLSPVCRLSQHRYADRPERDASPLHLPEGARTLRVSSVGYASKVVTITGKELRILLDNDEQSIDKVVIVAYGTQKKQSLVGAQASISGKQLAARPISNASNALAGAAAGVQVTTSSGQPGSEADIRIRGFGSVNASLSPSVRRRRCRLYGPYLGYRSAGYR